MSVPPPVDLRALPAAVDAPPRAEALEQRIAERSARIALLGLGHAGLPLAAELCRAGFRVLGHDIDAQRIARLARGERVLAHLAPELARELVPGRRFEPALEPERLRGAEVFLICVPTPLDAAGDPELGPVRAAARAIAGAIAPGAPGALVVLCSTTYPGTTREIVARELERSGLCAGRDFELAYAPEREDPGRRDRPARSVARLVGGTTPRATELARALFAQAYDEVHRLSSPEAAEATKLVENAFRAVNIALVNELKTVCEPLGLDIWELLDAAATKPFGFLRFDPGPGVGGHCIPIDPVYLSWAARRAGARAELVELALRINAGMPARVLERLEAALREQGRELRGARVLLLGLAYKADVADTRESPALELWRELGARGAQLGYSDPHVPELRIEGRVERSRELEGAEIAAWDALVVVSAHAAFDWAGIARHARLVLDTRHALAARMRGDARYRTA